MEIHVLMLLGVIGMIAGTLVAIGAQRVPVHRAKLERSAAGFLVGGIALIALMFPMI
jgi:hypothetical protein